MAYPTATTKASLPLADDAFHILRDCRTLYLQQLGQLLQEAQRVPASAIQAFQQAVGAYFDEMVATRRRSGFEVARGLTASRISLVGESDLELEIRLGEFSARLMEATGSDLWRVYLRFVTLLNRPDLSTTDNPVGPRGIALGLMDFCAQLGENHDQTVARIDRLETYFAGHLTILYDALNRFLAERNVGTAQPAIITAPDAPAIAEANPATALQRKLRATAAELPGTGGEALGGSLSPAQQASVLARLDELDKADAAASAAASLFSGTATHPSLEALIPGLFDRGDDNRPSTPQKLDSRQVGIPGGTPEAASIDALALIFEAIFASASLPEAVKTALSSLQIPLLKVAVIDDSLFTAKRHPARLFLDRMARAAIGLPPDAAAGHPLCAKLQAIASGLRSEFAGDLAVFEPHIGDLDRLIAERDAAVARSAIAYLPLLHQAERRRQAARRCRQVIEKHLAPGTPAIIATFLRASWHKVLLVIWMEHGEQSAAWQENVALIDELLWSFQPKTDMDERKRLARTLQPMLQRLNAGMLRIGLREDEQAAFLDTCFALQTAAMRGASGSIPEETGEAAQPAASNCEPTLSELSAGNLLLKIFDYSGDVPDSSRPGPLPVRPGNWLFLAPGEGRALCGLLCAGDPDGRLQLLANPDWGFAVAIPADLLEKMLGTGSARTCSNESLFDSAAEKALQLPAPA